MVLPMSRLYCHDSEESHRYLTLKFSKSKIHSSKFVLSNFDVITDAVEAAKLSSIFKSETYEKAVRKALSPRDVYMTFARGPKR